MIKILDETKGELIAIEIKGKITKQDFNVFNPVLEKTIKNFDNPKIYMEIHEIDIPTFQAMWEDVKNIPTYNKLERLAVIGTKDWHETMAKLFGKLISPEVKYFDYDHKNDARQWLKSYSFHETT